MENLTQGRRPAQIKRNEKITFISVVISMISLAFALSSCSTTKSALPFATTNRQGEYPVLKNKPVKNNSTWNHRQWGHEGR